MDCIRLWDRKWWKVFTAILQSCLATLVKIIFTFFNNNFALKLVFLIYEGFQKWIGFEDIISSPTYFYVQKSLNDFNQINTPIPFEVERLNVGGAMNLQTGKFTAPRTGKYFFSLSGLGYFPPSSSNQQLHLHLVKNGSRIANAHSDSTSPGGHDETFSLQSTLQLQIGDQIWVDISSISAGAHFHGNTYTHFTGWLLQEDVSLSLI
jgi:hypothetical protein